MKPSQRAGDTSSMVKKENSFSALRGGAGTLKVKSGQTLKAGRD
jgi:hypothetical protein